jgi:multiple sugar transport system substrate-binding protein
MKQVSRREMLRYMAAGAAGTILAACAPKATEAPTTAPAAEEPQGEAPAAEEVNLVLWTYPDDDIYFTAEFEDYKAKNPGVNLEIVKLDAADLDQKLTTAMVSGSGAPDLADLEQGWLGKYREGGGLLDLRPYRVEQYKDNYPAFAWNAGITADSSAMNMIYYSVAPAVIHYRRSVFGEQGLPAEPEEVEKLISADWEAYMNAARELSKPDGPYMFDGAGTVFGTYREQYNPVWYKDDVLYVDTPENLDGLNLSKQARDEGLDAKLSSWTPEWENSFKTALVASYPSGDWLQGLIKIYGGEETKGDWGMVPVPGTSGASIGGSTLSIPKQSANADAAYKLLEYFSFDYDAQLKMFVLTTCFPSWKPTWDDAVMSEPVEYYGGQPSRLVSVKVAKEFSDRVYSKFDNEIAGIVDSEVTNVLEQGKDPAQALKDADATCKSQLELG